MKRWIEVERYDGKKPDLLDYMAGAVLGISILVFIALPLAIISLIVLPFQSQKGKQNDK